MNLQQLRYLVATVDHGTMTAAARELHVSQPALSRGIRELEHELGVTVFRRAGRNVTVAPDAGPIVAAARRAVADVDDLLAAARAASDAALTVTTTSSMETLLTASVLTRYAKRWPDTHVRMLRADGSDAVEDLVARGRAELGLMDRLPREDLVARPFADQEVVLISPSSLPLPSPVPLSALDGMRLILPAAGSARRRESDEFFSTLGVRPTVVLETDERPSWTTAVLAGLGSVLWFSANADDAASGGAAVRPLDPPITRTLHLVHRRDTLSRAGAAFLDAACSGARPGRCTP